MSPSSGPPIRRAQPLLGTQVAISVGGVGAKAAHAAIDRGFAAVARIHRLMSFHEAESDLSRLNAGAARHAISVHEDTYAVLAKAQELSGRSNGVFDVTVAGRLVAAGFLPRPEARRPNLRASWRDIELLGRKRVRFAKPLWVDLGGIAKGYAVDVAIAAMALPARAQVVINAGGDLRIAGPGTERVLLRAPVSDGMLAVVELQDGSLASSSGRETRKRIGGREVGPHFHGRTHAPIGTRSFASVLAPECVLADGLTKVVLALGTRAEGVLRSYGAVAHLYSPGRGWRTLGADE